MRDITYPPIIVAARLLFRALGLRFQMRGTENVPVSGGAVLAVNHISYVDFVLGGYAAHPSRRLVRFMAKRELFDHRYVGPLMRSLHHINVDRADGVDSYREALRYLGQGELVGIFPEATISRSFEIKELKTGATRLAAEADVPLLPVILWGTQRLLTKDHPRDLRRGKTIAIEVGEPMYFAGDDPVADTTRLRATMARMLAETISAYPATEQPAGSWWLPASWGGSAPTPDEAERRDEAGRRARRGSAARSAPPTPRDRPEDK